MNNNNLKEEVTILKTWKGETFEIDMKYEDYLIMEQELKGEGEDGFNSSKYRRFIKFSAVEDKIGKTKYIALESPKDIEKTSSQLKQDRIRLQEVHERWKEKPNVRKKHFIENRNKILEKLAIQEKEHGLETTIKKVERYNREELEKTINSIKE